jgi:hypothetical protein
LAFLTCRFRLVPSAVGLTEAFTGFVEVRAMIGSDEDAEVADAFPRPFLSVHVFHSVTILLVVGGRGRRATWINNRK